MRTSIPDDQLRLLGWTGIAVSVAAGIYLAVNVGVVVLAWLPPSAFVVLAYDKELFNGLFHNRTVFALGWGGLPTLRSYFLQTFTVSVVALLTAAATVVFSVAIWTLNHEFRPDLNAVQDATLKLNGDFVAARRRARQRIWTITRILCYCISLFTLIFAYYRFFP